MKTLLHALVALSVLVTEPAAKVQKVQNAAPAVSSPPAQLLAQAQQALDQKEYARAATLLKTYVQEAPDDPVGHFQLGYALTALEQWDEAEAEYRTAARLDPHMFAAQLNLGLVLLRSRPSDAVDPLEKAVALAPQDARAHLLLAQALERSGRLLDAVDEYRATTRLDARSFDARLGLARALLRSGQTEAAEAAFRDALHLNPRSPAAHAGRAEALLHLGRPAEARDEFEHYLSLVPNDTATRLQLVSLLLDLHRPDEALDQLSHISENAAGAPAFHRLRARAWVEKGDTAAARQELERALQLSPNDAALEAELGHLLVLQKDYAPAIMHLQRALSLQPNDAQAVQDLAAAEYLSSNYNAALSALDRLAALGPLAPIAWFVRATCLDHLGQVAQAIEAYQKFLSLSHGQYDREEFQARQRLQTLLRMVKKKR